ncbi:DYW domain [Dillenia turbinata]|uniref:DYW domain n=1 Tax=Dillenia turbinata TaxID=194707 RepID=A0AAN8YTM3_9MAGN
MVEPNLILQNALIDMYAACGKMDATLRVFESMKNRDVVSWTAIVRGFTKLGQIDLAQKDKFSWTAVIVGLAINGCGEALDMGIKKIPGCSTIEMNRIVHEFLAGYELHAQSNDIYVKLEKMAEDLKKAGYMPDKLAVFLNIGEEEKENALYCHSGKLAMAFGLINSKPGVAIRILKNIRMCVDCHNVAKLVSKMYEREVIIRDQTRSHHFRHGTLKITGEATILDDLL